MFDELIAILDQLDAVYNRLLVQSGEERAVLVGADLDALRRLNLEKQALAARAEVLEAARCKVVNALAAQLPNRPPATVAGLADSAAPAQARRLHRAASRLKETAGRLQAANAAGMDLIGDSLKVVRGALQLLGLCARPGTYARSGNTPARSVGRILSAEG